MLLTVQELINSTKGSLYRNDEDVLSKGCTSVVIDSRNVSTNSLFIPLVGEFQDGHGYVESACKNGATIVLVQSSSLEIFSPTYDLLASQHIVIIVVENTLRALQNAAHFYISKFPKLKKIAITGSNGKTTVKECIGSVLAQKFNVIMNVGNLNSETGLPLSMFTVRSEHEIGIFEMGMNRRGEIKELADVFFPELAVITNIGTAHIGILGTQQAIAEEKKEIFSNFHSNCIGFIFEDELYSSFLQKDVTGTMYTYGPKSTKGIQNIANQGIRGSIITYKHTDIHFPLIGDHNAANACAAICIAQYCNLNVQEIKNGLEAVTPLFGRSQIIEGSPTIIQDCYNGSFESMSASLDFFISLHWVGKKIAVLGDMLELGEKSREIHYKIFKQVMDSDVDVVIFVGEHFSACVKNYTERYTKTVYYTDKTDDDSIAALCNIAKKTIEKQDIVLFKGSRGIKLERVISLLQYNKQEAV